MRADSIASLRARRAFVRAFCGALLLAVGGNASSLPGKRYVGRYDFGYAIRGDKPARPAQVFDDGSGKVYFEARPNQPMPAVFAGKDLALLVTQPEGQYFTARTSASEFTLVLGGARAVVRRGDAALGDEVVLPQEDAGRQLASVEGLTPGVDYGVLAMSLPALHEQPVVFAPRSAALRPEVRDALSALVVRIGHDASISVIGRNDAGQADSLATLRAQALRNALLARGVAAQRIELVDVAEPSSARAERASVLRWRSAEAAGSSGEAGPLDFEVLPADRHIAVTLRRWAQASGYAIDWDVDWEAPINGGLRVRASSFPDAVRQVVAGLRAQGYPVQAQRASDRLIRLVSAD